MKFNPRRFRKAKKPAQQKREALPKSTFDALLKDNENAQGAKPFDLSVRRTLIV